MEVLVLLAFHHYGPQLQHLKRFKTPACVKIDPQMVASAGCSWCPQRQRLSSRRWGYPFSLIWHPSFLLTESSWIQCHLGVYCFEGPLLLAVGAPKKDKPNWSFDHVTSVPHLFGYSGFLPDRRCIPGTSSG